MKKYTQTYLHTHTLVCKNSGEASIQITPINKNSKKGFPHSQINKIALLSLLSLIICVSILVCVCVFMLVYKCCKTLTINLSFRKQVINSVTCNNITVLLADNPIQRNYLSEAYMFMSISYKITHLRIFYGNQKTKSWHGV